MVRIGIRREMMSGRMFLKFMALPLPFEAEVVCLIAASVWRLVKELLRGPGYARLAG